MIIGTHLDRLKRADIIRLICLAILVGWCTIAAAQSPLPQERVDSIWNLLQSIQNFQTEFQEQKHLTLFTEPLISQGDLYYRKPDVLVKETTMPFRESLRITAGQMTTISPDLEIEKTVDINSQPMAKAVVEHMLWIFNGDRAALEKNFKIRYESSANELLLIVLEPIDFRLKKGLSQIRIQVSDNLVPEVIEVLEPGGDQTVTRYFNSKINQSDLKIPGIVE